MTNNDKLKNYHIETLKNTDKVPKDFDFYSFEYFVKDIEHLRKSHRHDFYAFIINTSGKGSHIIDFQEHEIKPNRIFFINYGQVHSWKNINKVRGYVVLFTKSFYDIIFTGNNKIKSDSALINLLPYVDVDEKEMHEWLFTMKLIETEYLVMQENTEEIICLLLKTCILRYSRATEKHTYKNPKDDHRFLLFMDYKNLIQTNYKRLKSPKDYASILHITPNYLNSVAKGLTGLTAGEHIKQRVILEAKRLLTHTDLTVTQISYELGFNDKSHFGKYFKSAEALTPQKFRVQNKTHHH